MKILFLADGFWPNVGGIETQGLQFIEGMQQRGHQYWVLAQKDDASFQDDEIYQGISIRRFAFKTGIKKRQLDSLRQAEAYLKWVIDAFQPDVVHLNACIGEMALVFLLLKSVLKAPIVQTVHSPYFYLSESKTFVHLIAPQVDQICCVSNWVLNEMEKLVPMARGKLRLVYNGLPMPEIAPMPLSFTPPTFLLLGRFSFEKGFDTAIYAFSLLKQRGSSARLLIAGKGVDRLFLEELVHRLRLSDSVHFVGGLAKGEVASVINRATAMIVPSYFETFGLVALEAMQMERPVIGSAVGGLQEVISDGETGLLVPPHDPVALSSAMGDLIARPERAIKMGVNGRKRALERFTLSQNMDQYEAAYRDAMRPLSARFP